MDKNERIDVELWNLVNDWADMLDDERIRQLKLLDGQMRKKMYYNEQHNRHSRHSARYWKR